VVIEGLSSQVAGKKLLLVDEIGDSGGTIVKAKEHLEDFRPKQIWSVVPVIKPQTRPQPDIYIHTTDKWVVFPYEVRETIENLADAWGREGMKRGKVSKRLVSLGFTKQMVNRFLKK